MAQKMLPTVDLEAWSTTINLNKGYQPENTADEGGSAEKSQECHRYPSLQSYLKRNPSIALVSV
jgi:hypothetical protein